MSGETLPEGALEDVAYLSRSANRVRILDALATEARTRRQLAEDTDVSRATLDRIVTELEERGWAERTPEGEYATTATGTHLVREFEPFVASVDALRTLGDAIEWLPTEELDIDLRHFRDATVREPDRDDPVDTIDFMVSLVRNASEFRALTDLVPPASFLEATRDGVVAGGLTFDAVVPEANVDVLGDGPERAAWWGELLDAGTELYAHPGPVPCNVWLFDELVLIKRSDPGPVSESYGTPIVTTDATVRSWAHDLVDRYRADATPVDPGAHPEAD